MNKKVSDFGVIVVGGGHAGCEAALVSARMGVHTLLVTASLKSIATMPCNPSIGGLAKSHLVREVDALGGEMGINADCTGLQFKTLNPPPQRHFGSCLYAAGHLPAVYSPL